MFRTRIITLATTKHKLYTFLKQFVILLHSELMTTILMIHSQATLFNTAFVLDVAPRSLDQTVPYLSSICSHHTRLPFTTTFSDLGLFSRSQQQWEAKPVWSNFLSLLIMMKFSTKAQDFFLLWCLIGRVSEPCNTYFSFVYPHRAIQVNRPRIIVVYGKYTCILSNDRLSALDWQKGYCHIAHHSGFSKV